MLKRYLTIAAACMVLPAVTQAQEPEPAQAEKPAVHTTRGIMDPASCNGLWGIYVVNHSTHRVRIFWAETMASEAQYIGPVAQADSGIAYFRTPHDDLPQVWLDYQGEKLYVDGKNDISGYRLKAILDCDPRGQDG